MIRNLSKQRLYMFMLVVLFLGVLYLYLNYVQVNNETIESGDRCMSELTSLKYQLVVVTEYKNRIDKFLTDTHKKHQADIEKYKDIIESCLAMKQQAAICQSQFEDLQGECRIVREEYDVLKKKYGEV